MNRTEYTEAQMTQWEREGKIALLTDASVLKPGDTILQWITGKDSTFAVPGKVTRAYKRCGYAEFEFEWAGGSKVAKFFADGSYDAAWRVVSPLEPEAPTVETRATWALQGAEYALAELHHKAKYANTADRERMHSAYLTELRVVNTLRGLLGRNPIPADPQLSTNDLTQPHPERCIECGQRPGRTHTTWCSHRGRV